MDDNRHGDFRAEQQPSDKQAAGSGSKPGNGSSLSRTPWQTVEGRVLCLVSRKGGVGKTTSAVNLGAALALSGHTVLVVGTDPQCGVCRTLGTAPRDLPHSLDDIFTAGTPLTRLAQPSPLENLFFVSPRITTLAEEEAYLANLERCPDDFVREFDRARNLYDTILIDCPPSLGPATRAALLAADGFLVPVQAEELCRTSLESLLGFVEDFRDRSFGDSDGGHGPDLEGLFLTMSSDRTRMGRHVADQVGQEYEEALLETRIPRTTRLSEMALRGKPAVIYDRRSPGSRAYFDLADELVRRYCNGAGDDLPAGPKSRDAAAADQPAAPAGHKRVARASEPDTEPGDDGMGGLGRFLADLGSLASGRRTQAQFEEPSLPEMVSLDDLLAEEERRTGPGFDDDADGWAYDLDAGDTMN